MDIISILDVAASILSVEELLVQLISSSDRSEWQLSLDDKDENMVLERLRKRICALSEIHASVHPSASDGVLPPSGDILALRELASSCVERSRVLLDDLENILKDSLGRSSQKLESDANAQVRSRVRDRIYQENIGQLSNGVMRYVSSILRCATRLTSPLKRSGDTDM
jgi:hypothetical protein